MDCWGDEGQESVATQTLLNETRTAAMGRTGTVNPIVKSHFRLHDSCAAACNEGINQQMRIPDFGKPTGRRLQMDLQLGKSRTSRRVATTTVQTMCGDFARWRRKVYFEMQGAIHAAVIEIAICGGLLR